MGLGRKGQRVSLAKIKLNHPTFKQKMKIKSSIHFSILTLFASLLSFSFFAPKALAQSPNDYGRQFGLFIHEQNEDLTVPRFKGLQVLESFFVGSPLKPSYEGANQFMTQREFLLRFEKLRLEDQGKETELSDDDLYPLTWIKARRFNWLPKTKLTYEVMQEFLYRYSVSEKHGGVPYYEGLVLEEEEISVDRFSSIEEVRNITQKLRTHAAQLRKLTRPTITQKVLLASLDQYQQSFSNLEQELKMMEHPLYKIPNLPEDIQEKIKSNDLNEILDAITYNYSTNNENRIYNLVTGAMQMSGRVFQPGEIIDLTEELGRDDGWDNYKYGWVIMGKTEAWRFGGGLCGTATITFTPSWRAGLEIISRYPHTTYYRSLYPGDSFGLDATIYRGSKNLVMKNSTESPLLYYVKDDPEKMEITMYLIGNSPYKNIEIEGPIKTGLNRYKSIRRMERFDGTVVEDELFTRYDRIK